MIGEVIDILRTRKLPGKWFISEDSNSAASSRIRGGVGGLYRTDLPPKATDTDSVRKLVYRSPKIKPRLVGHLLSYARILFARVVFTKSVKIIGKNSDLDFVVLLQLKEQINKTPSTQILFPFYFLPACNSKNKKLCFLK